MAHPEVEAHSGCWCRSSTRVSHRTKNGSEQKISLCTSPPVGEKPYALEGELLTEPTTAGNDWTVWPSQFKFSPELGLAHWQPRPEECSLTPWKSVGASQKRVAEECLQSAVTCIPGAVMCSPAFVTLEVRSLSFFWTRNEGPRTRSFPLSTLSTHSLSLYSLYSLYSLSLLRRSFDSAIAFCCQPAAQNDHHKSHSVFSMRSQQT